MLSFSNVVHLFAHKLSGLRAGRFSLFLIPSCSLNNFFLRHFSASYFGSFSPRELSARAAHPASSYSPPSLFSGVIERNL
jgi:hypothetical protein